MTTIHASPPSTGADTPLQRVARQALRDHWKLFAVQGAMLMAFGLAAILLPTVAALTLDILVGWLLFVVGVFGVVSTASAADAPGYWSSLLLAGLTALLGLVIVFAPAQGILTLSAALIAYFLVHGIGMIVLAASMRNHTGRWWWLVLSALVDVLLAGLMLAGWPATAGWLLGLYVGINLTFAGLGLLLAAIGVHATQP